MFKVPYIVLPHAVVITLNSEQYTINRDHPNFQAVVDAIKAKAWNIIENLINIPKAIEAAAGGFVKVANGQVIYKDLPVHSYLATRILDLLRDGFDVQPWINFMDKLYQNPDPYSIVQLYPFLERAKLPLHPDGDFLAYKYVNKDYTDCRTGTFDNSVGKVVALDRATCDNNPDNHCSSGLHFCSKGYLPGYGNERRNRVVLVKVNPRDVVSVPNDHSFEKARTCRYEVVGELDVDYSFEDMKSSSVLPSPRVVEEVNKSAKPAKASGPTELQLRVINSSAIKVSDLAKNLGVTQSSIIQSAGKYYKFVPFFTDCPLGEFEVYIKQAASKHVK